MIIRTTAFLSFIFFIGLFTACNSSSAEQAKKVPKEPVNLPSTVSDKPKIVAFGTSLTAGFGLLEKESYPYLLQEKLKANGYDYEVINAGVSGDTTAGGLERIDWSLEQDNVQIIIIELGGNDLLRGLPVAKMKENLDKIITKAKAKKIQVLLCGMLAPPTMGAKYQKEFVEVFPDLAEKHKVAFVPFILEGIALDKALNQPDGIHPNAEGEKIIVETVYTALKPLLKK